MLLGMLVLGIEALLCRSPLDLRGLFSARSLWGLLLLGVAFGAFNQALRSHVVADVWKVPGRSVLGVLAALVIGAALVRGSSMRLRVHLFERVLALGLIPAVLGAGIYFTRGASAESQAPAAGSIIALAPRFTPEPKTVYPEELAEFLPVDDSLWEEFRRTQTFSKDVALSAFRSTYLSDAFREEREVLRVARYGDPLTEARAIPSEIDAALTEKLKALGYMD